MIKETERLESRFSYDAAANLVSRTDREGRANGYAYEAAEASFELLLARCTTVWLQAAPEDHMQRVRAQGDLRPMAASREAMDDLKGILAGRAPFYAKATLSLDTSAQALPETFGALRSRVRETLGLPAAPEVVAIDA